MEDAAVLLKWRAEVQTCADVKLLSSYWLREVGKISRCGYALLPVNKANAVDSEGATPLASDARRRVTQDGTKALERADSRDQLARCS